MKTKLNLSIIILLMVVLIFGASAGTITGFYAGKMSAQNWLKEQAAPKAVNQSLDNQKTDNVISQDRQEELSIVSAVQKVSPSVVSIIVTKEVSLGSPFSTDDFFDIGWPFGFRFQVPQQPQQSPKTERQEIGGGTGFVISSVDGLILTNKHVAADEAAEYTIVTNTGEKIAAKVLARDPFNDIAILKIDKKGLVEVQLGDSDKLQMGQTVIAIGNALGEYRNTVTRGVISGIGRNVIAGDGLGQSEALENVIQTDAAINPGNSGGPLVNLAGQVVGINVAVNRSGQLIGFAIPINQAKQVISSVKKTGKIVRPFMGVRYTLINDKIVQANNLKVNYGALIVRGSNSEDLAIVPGSPADKAGLVENDIILELNGQKITEEYSLAKEIQKHQPGDVLTLKILHKGEEKTVKVTLEEYKQ